MKRNYESPCVGSKKPNTRKYKVTKYDVVMWLYRVQYWSRAEIEMQLFGGNAFKYTIDTENTSIYNPNNNHIYYYFDQSASEFIQVETGMSLDVSNRTIWPYTLPKVDIHIPKDVWYLILSKVRNCVHLFNLRLVNKLFKQVIETLPCWQELSAIYEISTTGKNAFETVLQYICPVYNVKNFRMLKKLHRNIFQPLFKQHAPSYTLDICRWNIVSKADICIYFVYKDYYQGFMIVHPYHRKFEFKTSLHKYAYVEGDVKRFVTPLRTLMHNLDADLDKISIFNDV